MSKTTGWCVFKIVPMPDVHGMAICFSTNAHGTYVAIKYLTKLMYNPLALTKSEATQL